MKKLTAVLTAILLLILSACTYAETIATDPWVQLDGHITILCSNSDIWFIDLSAKEDGSFTGDFYSKLTDETGEDYPYGTFYECSVHGRFSDPEPIDEYTWKVKITMEPDADQVPEEIIDGIRIATAAFSGLEKKQTALILLPGASVDHLPGGYAVWADPLILPPDEMTLPYYIIWVDSDEIR